MGNEYDSSGARRLSGNAVTLLITALLCGGSAALIYSRKAAQPAGTPRCSSSMACVNIILAVSLNLVTGFLGQLSLGHAGFMSVGAYSPAACSPFSWRRTSPIGSAGCLPVHAAGRPGWPRWSACWWACPPCGSRATTWPSSPWPAARSSGYRHRQSRRHRRRQGLG